MRALTLLAACLALSGCTVAMHGHQTSGSGGTATSSALKLQAGSGGARASGSFGAPAPKGAPGAQVSLSRGASAVLVIGLVVAETLHYLGARAGGQPAPGAGLDRAISETCSCYGYRPPEPATAMRAE
jgi:hypothetical protein